jgi:hypothetical protein
MAQMQAFLQNQPTIDLPAVPQIAGLSIPQFSPVTPPGITLQ